MAKQDTRTTIIYSAIGVVAFLLLAPYLGLRLSSNEIQEVPTKPRTSSVKRLAVPNQGSVIRKSQKPSIDRETTTESPEPDSPLSDIEDLLNDKSDYNQDEH